MFNVALISPGREGSVVSGQWKGFVNFYRLTLPLIAGLTPHDRYRVWAYDESVDRVPRNKEFDLVAMSVMTPYAPRAYELSRFFQEKGATVVLGGQHPTLLPQEVEQHADVTVVGDAELTWPRVLADFERGRLQRRYDAGRMGLEDTVIVKPHRDIITDKSLLVFNTIETSRGCPYTCEYCTIASFYESAYRKYSLDAVVEDMASIPGKYLFFVDDNLIGGSPRDRRRTKELLRAIAPLNKVWFCQSTIKIADDDELLKLATDAGCAGLYVGLESISHASLKEVRKGWNQPASYEERIRRIRDHGIAIEAGFIFGFDHDDASVFEETAAFVERTGVESPNAHILTPYPGTPLYQRMNEQGRVFSHDWSKYNTGHVVFQPALMTPDQLSGGYEWWYRTVFSPRNVLRRIRKANFRYYTALMNAAKGIEVRRRFMSNGRHE